MNFPQAAGAGLRNALKFSGRASQAEFWWFALFCALVYSVAAIPGAIALSVEMMKASIPGRGVSAELQAARVAEALDAWLWAPTLAVALLAVPAWSAAARRLHDADLPGLIAAPVAILGLGFVGLDYWESLNGRALLPRGGADMGLREYIGYAVTAAFGLPAILLARKGTDRPNRYGPDPRTASVADAFA